MEKMWEASHLTDTPRRMGKQLLLHMARCIAHWLQPAKLAVAWRDPPGCGNEAEPSDRVAVEAVGEVVHPGTGLMV